MESLLSNILHIVAMNGMVMILPGVNFLLVARQSVLNGAQAGLFCASGIATAVLTHALLAGLSVSVLIAKYPFLFTCIRYGGAAYLLYLGTTFLKKAIQNQVSAQELDLNLKNEAFRSGFFVDLFNPFISIFYLTLFASIDFGENKAVELSSYLLVIFILTITWFSLVAVFFNHSFIRETLHSKSRYIQALSGLAMYYFAAKVIF